MTKFRPHSFIKSLKTAILYIAILHLCLLTIYAVTTHNWVYLNIANILDLQLYFKTLPYNFTVGLISIIPVAALIAWLYFKDQA